MLFRAKAPLRVSFAGGGTDVPPFPAQEGGLVLSATINKYAYGTLRPRADRQIRITSADLRMTLEYQADDPMHFDGNLDLVKAAIRNLGGREDGYDLFRRSSAPPGSGLGSSHRLPVTDYEIADLAYRVERHDLGIKGGLQDQYAATFGGFNFIEFADEHVIVNPLRIGSDTINELEHNMLLCFTGKTRVSDRIIDDQTERYRGGDA
jgi:D-glycero-alpha-D-manno-heptose-7-phosphate kinase